VKVLFIGDIVGRPGRSIVEDCVPELRRELRADYVIANAENAAAGFGATPAICEELLQIPIDLLTMGNHVYAKREIEDYLGRTDRVIRPANLPESAPGSGFAVVSSMRAGVADLAVVNLQGVVFMQSLSCPFEVGRRVVAELREQTPCVIIDFHAEATAEKVALANYLDGRCSALLGTHTHVATADERVLPGGTAYITDVGMTGPTNSIIGMSKELVERRFVRKMPSKFAVAEEPPELCGALIDIDDATGRARAISRVHA
jgi:2',3'-cyclic-nucleotide 2'-phosphodiesterase